MFTPLPNSRLCIRHAHRCRAFIIVQVDKLTAEELEVVLQERTKPLIIDFYATWCGPCLLLAKELEQVRDKFHGSCFRKRLADVAPHQMVHSCG